MPSGFTRDCLLPKKERQMNKESVSLRIAPDDLEWLKRHGRKWSQQLRRDIRTLRMLCNMVEEGMSDHPLGKMMLMADSEFRD